MSAAYANFRGRESICLHVTWAPLPKPSVIRTIVIWVARPKDQTALIANHLHGSGMQGGGSVNPPPKRHEGNYPSAVLQFGTRS